MSASSSSKSEVAAKRARLGSKLLAQSGGTKTFLAKTLIALHDAGLLTDKDLGGGSERVVRGSLSTHAQRLAAEATPFGPCVQEMSWAGKPWKYLHPLALVFLLSTLSEAFGKLMSDIIAGNRTLSVILYCDEFRPGNVLRPDKGRGTQNILWIFSDFPDWFVCRADAWFQFGVMRTSTLLEEGDGAASALMRKVLKTFWCTEGGPNLQIGGGLVQHGNDTLLYKARFGGFLGDEKGMKEVFNSKGPAGMKPCLSCKNICQFLPVTPTSYLQGIEAPPSKFDRASDEEVWCMADKLRDISATGTRKLLNDSETALGLNFSENSLLFDQELRSMVKPVTGWIRDWMHMLCIGGVANIEVEQMLTVLKDNNVSPNLVTTYFSNWKLPKVRGTIDQHWFTTKRMGRPNEERDGWKGFGSELLIIIPIMSAFLSTGVAPSADATLLKHIRCFILLDKVIQAPEPGG